MDELNYYELLDLDPTVEDLPSIEKRIQEKQRLWSRQTTEGSPRDARLAARNLRLLDPLRRTMLNPALRAPMADKARRLQEQRRRDARSGLSALLAFAKGKVGDTEQFITRDCARYVRELGRPEVQRLVDAAGITARQATPPPPRRESLDPTTARRIREGLDHIGKRDLYEFLGLSRRCTAKSLCDKAEQINRALLQSGRTDDEAAAAKELAGQCMALFTAESGRERYTTTLLDEKLDAALRDFLPLAAQNNALGRKEVTELAGIAARHGIAPSDTENYLRDLATRRKWAWLAESSAEAALPGHPCGYCGCLPRSDDDQFCWNCNRKRKITCPKCRSEQWSDQSACADCGASIEDAEIVDEDLRLARLAFERNDLDESAARLSHALELWPDWQDALDLRRKLEAKEQRRQTQTRRLMSLIRERRMFEAQDCIEEAGRDAVPGAFTRATDIIGRTLAEANRHFNEGETRKAAGQLHEAAQCYEQALALCTDMKAAQDALSRIPPLPPAILEASADDTTPDPLVRLRWEPGREGALFAYTLVRKHGTPPLAPDDGAVLLKAAPVTTFEDRPPGGLFWHYAVFAVRRNLASTRSASAGPLLLTPPLADLRLTPGDGQVQLAWTLPDNAQGVDIRRAEKSPPPTPGAGVPVLSLHDQAVDDGLQNGLSYGYAVRVRYADPSTPEGVRLSAPCVGLAMPAPSLDKVTDLRGLAHDGILYLNWTPPATDRVHLLRLPAQLAASLPSHPLRRSALHEYGGEGEPVATPPASLPVKPDEVVVPLTLRDHLVLFGAPARVHPLMPVRDLLCETGIAELIVRWRWPQGVDSALVVWSTDTWPPERDDPLALPARERNVTVHSALCLREADEACFTLPVLTPRRHYIRVFSSLPGQAGFSQPASCFTSMGVLDVVRYRVLRTGLFTKTPSSIELRSETLSRLGGIQVRGREGCVPLAPEDGVLITSVESVTLRGGRAEIPIPTRFRKARWYVKLFHVNPEEAAAVRLMPAQTEELRLG